MRLANIAAGVVVTKQGTATCTLAEIEDELQTELYTPDIKVRSLAQAQRIASQWRKSGLRVGFTNGCFDLLHPGHIQILQRSRAACDRLIVGINTDASVKRNKGPNRPVQDEISRAIVLSALASVDMVVLFDDETPYDLIRTLRPIVLLKGADYTLDQVVGADLVKADGGEVLLVDLIENQSTTAIIKRMAR
jgi:D-beta-D-heptose 7-phosphate kinase/D-beta-D-heptose 1-phosphate adenosyltransferase